jgi:phosphoenolpyruvate carboxykinase (GTP)
VPKKGDLDVSGLKISEAEVDELLRIDVAGWKGEVPEIEEYLNKAGTRLPERMKTQLAELKKRIGL